MECKSFRENDAAIKKYKIAFFAASCDDPDTNRKFAESLKLEYPILSDPDGKVAKSYGIYKAMLGFPSRATFYIDKDGKIAAIDTKVNVRNAGKDVAKKLKSLGFESAD